jgi:hypothetical protein
VGRRRDESRQYGIGALAAVAAALDVVGGDDGPAVDWLEEAATPATPAEVAAVAGAAP